MAQDVKLHAQSLSFDDNLLAKCSNDETALAAYTRNTKSGKQTGNLYSELNNSLRERGAPARAGMMKA